MLTTRGYDVLLDVHGMCLPAEKCLLIAERTRIVDGRLYSFPTAGSRQKHGPTSIQNGHKPLNILTETCAPKKSCVCFHSSTSSGLPALSLLTSLPPRRPSTYLSNTFQTLSKCLYSVSRGLSGALYFTSSIKLDLNGLDAL